MARPEGAERRGRLRLLAIAALFAAPVVLGGIAYWVRWAPGTAVNYGTLLAPSALEAEPLAALRGRWVLVQLDSGSCDEHCVRKLYLMRQVRRAQGEKMRRIERLWLVTDATAPAPGLLAAYEGTRVVRATRELIDAFPADRAPTDHIYLVDPMGNLMMRFPRDPDPSRVLKDLERLLRYSSFG